jgi:hypothetical protein
MISAQRNSHVPVRFPADTSALRTYSDHVTLPHGLCENAHMTLASPVVSSNHAPAILPASNALLLEVASAEVTIPEARLRRRARRQGLALLAFSSLISLSSIAAVLAWLF